jgi:hypothetical protein
MNSTKSILAVSAAVSALVCGAANASTVGTNTVTLSGSGAGGLESSTGKGTGTLLSTGSYTDSITNDTSVTSFGLSATIGETDSWTGTYLGGTFTPTSGTTTDTSCTGSTVICNALTLNSPVAFTTVGGSFVFATGGTLTAAYTLDGESANETYKIGAGTATSPPVPLPPAVWLLGSGLLGLLGTGHRRPAGGAAGT